MQKKLTQRDQLKIKNTNLFRLNNDWYLIVNSATMIVYIYSFFFPYYGWRKKPFHIPENLNQYIHQVLDMHLFFLPLVILAMSNFMIKKIEIKRNYKIEKATKVILKRKIFRKIHIIIFKTFHILFFSNTFRYNDIKENDNIIIEITSLGRFLNYKKQQNEFI